ncbi:MAG TPA: hypothetical protein VET23_00515 [Chitinophagaceae bacterium]|nr:hypothetical protein [Chitinophagaceae bacterium]
MKPRFTLKKFVQASLSIVAFGLLLMQPVFSLAMPVKKKPAILKNEDPGEKYKNPRKGRTSVKVYPDALSKVIHVVTKESKGKQIDFFVFDLQGTLVFNYRMKPKDHQKITGLAKGSYVYNVFSGDVQTASGNFEIK